MTISLTLFDGTIIDYDLVSRVLGDEGIDLLLLRERPDSYRSAAYGWVGYAELMNGSAYAATHGLHLTMTRAEEVFRVLRRRNDPLEHEPPSASDAFAR